MKFCPNCGVEVNEKANICNNCGAKLENNQFSRGTVSDKPDIVLNIVSFLIPLVGLVLYIMYHEKAPNKAKSIAVWALIGFVLGLVFSLIGSIFSFALGIFGL